MQRDTFVFYKDWKEAIRDLPDDIRLEIYESIIEYATTGNIKGLKPMANVAFNFMKTTIDRDVQSYVDKCEKNRSNGKKGADYGKLGGRPKNPEKPPITPNGVLKTPNNPEKPIDSDSDSDLDSDLKERTSNDVPKKRFVKPTIQQVAVYCESRKSGISAQEFVDHYEAVGWVVGKNKMKDWKAAVRTWENRRKSTQQSHYNPEQTRY